jgi:hypothetical protein
MLDDQRRMLTRHFDVDEKPYSNACGLVWHTGDRQHTHLHSAATVLSAAVEEPALCRTRSRLHSSAGSAAPAPAAALLRQHLAPVCQPWARSTLSCTNHCKRRWHRVRGSRYKQSISIASHTGGASATRQKMLQWLSRFPTIMHYPRMSYQ